MSERTVKMVIPIGLPDDRNTIISKDCVVTLPNNDQPLFYGFDHAQPVGRWKAEKKEDSVEVNITLDDDLPKKLEEVFDNLLPWEALQYPYGFRPIKSRVDDDGITHFDEIELTEVSVAIKPPPAAIAVLNAEIMKDVFKPVTIRELTKDLEVDMSKVVEGTFAITPTGLEEEE